VALSQLKVKAATLYQLGKRLAQKEIADQRAACQQPQHDSFYLFSFYLCVIRVALLRVDAK
jgi:hypothetical protein